MLPRILHRSASRLAAAALLLLGLGGAAAAQQTGTVTGRVTAEEDGGPLAGATVLVSGTSRGTVTDAGGRFEIEGLVAGEHELEASLVGRRSRIRRLVVSTGSVAEVKIQLPLGPVLLPGMVVSAARVPRWTEESAATVNVLTREELRTSPGRTPDDILREMPGVELPRTSGTVSGPEQIVSIRGTDEGRALVLLDGIPLNDPWGEWIDWARAPVFSLSRVELVEGGGSSLYGNYAMGGVIQLFSRPIEADAFHLLASAGSRDLYELSAVASDVRGPLAFQADGSLAQGGGYVLAAEPGAIDEPTALSRRNVRARAEYSLSADRHVSVEGSFLDEDRDAGTSLSATERTIAGGAIRADLGDIATGRLTATLFGNGQSSESRQTRAAADRSREDLALVQTIPAHDAGGTLQWSRGVGFLESLALGGDFRYMVGSLDEDVHAAGAGVVQTRSSGGSQLVGGLFVQGITGVGDRLTLEASARVDGWRNFDGSREVSDSATTRFAERTDVAVAPRLGARMELLPGLSLHGSVYRAFRAPTLSEQYRTFISGTNTFLPNPDLGPEHLTGADVGFDWQPSPHFELRATVFDNEMEDLTSFAFLRPGFLQRQNVGEAHSRGVEAQLALRPVDWARLVASFNYDDARTAAGARVARVPLQRFVGRGTLGNQTLGELAVIYRHEGTMAALGGAVLDPYDVVDLTARHSFFRGTGLYVALENVTDARYAANRSGSFEQLGLPRTLRIGVTLSD